MTNKNIDSNRENSKEHVQERVSNYNDRENRANNRDTEIVKLPDGREFVRNPRTYLKRHGALSDLPKISENWRIDECEYSYSNNLHPYQKLMRKNTKNTVRNNICRMSNDRAKKVFEYMNQGDIYIDLPKEIREILPFREDIFKDKLKRLVNNNIISREQYEVWIKNNK